MLLYYGLYRKGHMPQPGAVMDQANKAIEVFRVFDDVNAECDEALIDKSGQAERGIGRRRSVEIR